MELTHRDVIVAAIVTFVAWGYAVHWLPILRYVVYSFVAGVAVTSIVVGALILSTSRGEVYDGIRAYRKSKTVAFVAAEAWKEETKSLKAHAEYRRGPLYPPSFVVSDSLDTLLVLILRDFITSWYSNISRSLSFTNEVDRAIRTALINIRDRIFGVDFVEVTVSRFIPIVTEHLREFDQAERVVRGEKLNRNVTESEELDLAIAGRYREGKLHPAASLSFSDTKLMQQEHLRRTVVRLLPEILPENVIRSRAVSVLLKEIVACAVLSPVMQLLSEPDTWNQLMEAYVMLPSRIQGSW